MSVPESPDRRASMFIRFIMENMGGFIALVGVIFAAGIISGKLDTTEKSVAAVTTKVEAADVRIQNISVDVAVIKTKVETIEREQARK